jgi:hypothetical protein
MLTNKKITKTTAMKNSNFKVGQIVNYTNGNPSINTGEIVKIKETTLIVIEDASGIELWKAGYAVGSEITFNQVK